MSDIVCVTDRRLCAEDFLERIGRIAACHPAAVLLREKDLPEQEYEALARQVLAVCASRGVPCILHTWADTAERLGAKALQMPLPAFRSLCRERAGRSDVKDGCPVEGGGRVPAIGVSVHSAAEALEAERLGAAWLIAGHIYETDCKEGLSGRGLSFLREVCAAAPVPVLAIGGINAQNAADVRGAGAAGICVRSGCMRCADVERYFEGLQRALAAKEHI